MIEPNPGELKTVLRFPKLGSHLVRGIDQSDAAIIVVDGRFASASHAAIIR